MVTLYFQDVLGYTPAQAGSAILPIAVGIGVLSLAVYPRISRRISPLALVVPGMLTVAAGMLLLVFTSVHGHYLTNILPSMVLFAIAGGTAMPAIMFTAMSETAPDAAGSSSGQLSTSQQVGAAIGLAALSSIAVAATNHLSAHGHAYADATVGGYHLSWGIGAAGLTAAAAIAAMTLARRPGTGYEPAAVPADAAEATVEGPESVRV